MARSRKKPSTRSASNAKAAATAKPTDEVREAAAEPASSDDATTGTAKDPVATARSAKDPVTKKRPTGEPAAKKANAPGGEVIEKAKDSTRSTSVKKAAAAESSRATGRRVASVTQNPAWLAPTAVVLLILGLLYLVTYYISAGQLPLPIGDWNLAVGFGVLMVGGGMLMFWK